MTAHPFYADVLLTSPGGDQAQRLEYPKFARVYFAADYDAMRQRAEAAEHDLKRACDGRDAEMRAREAAERERDRWQEDSMRQAHTINRMAAAAEDRNEVDAKRHAYTEARIAQLEAALRKHGRHDSDCFKFSAMDTYRECTCGFDAALRLKRGIR